MKLNYLEIYLIAVNILSFIFYGLKTYLYKRDSKIKLNSLVYALVVIGGSLGALLSFIAFDRKPGKNNMMALVLTVCMLVIQIILLIVLKNNVKNGIDYNIIAFLSGHKIFLGFLAVMNVIAFILFGVDKYKAIHDKRRIRILTLLGVAFLGGSIGGILGMFVFRHKTQKDYFRVGMPLILVMQIFVLIMIMNVL